MSLDAREFSSPPDADLGLMPHSSVDDIFHASHWDDMEDDFQEGHAMMRDTGGVPLDLQSEVFDNPVTQTIATKRFVDVGVFRETGGPNGPKQVVEMVAEVLSEIDQALKEGIQPVLRLLKRKRNQCDDEEDSVVPSLSQANIEDEDGQPRKKKRSSRFSLIKHTTKRHTVLVKVLEIVHDLLKDNIPDLSARDIFYRFVSIFSTQKSVDEVSSFFKLY
ncbi:hypothetical protein HDU67_003947 [Dinochytrium kinnereticum]|nr:hypothetical protein HDU67_003947 [Dinochytrium kinnereticum]